MSFGGNCEERGVETRGGKTEERKKANGLQRFRVVKTKTHPRPSRFPEPFSHPTPKFQPTSVAGMTS